MCSSWYVFYVCFSWCVILEVFLGVCVYMCFFLGVFFLVCLSMCFFRWVTETSLQRQVLESLWGPCAPSQVTSYLIHIVSVIVKRAVFSKGQNRFVIFLLWGRFEDVIVPFFSKQATNKELT